MPPVLTDVELDREAILLAQRLRICELELELRQARDGTAKTHTDAAIVREHVAKYLTGCVPTDTLGILVKALDVVVADLVKQRDQLHFALQRPLPPPQPLPDNVVQLRRVQAVGKRGPWATREPLLQPGMGIRSVCRADDPSTTTNPKE